MAQEVERRLGKAEATGSNPVSSLLKKSKRFYLLDFFCCFYSHSDCLTCV